MPSAQHQSLSKTPVFYCDSSNLQSLKTKEVKGRLSPGFPGNVRIVYRIYLSFTASYVASKGWRSNRSPRTCLRALLPTQNQLPGHSSTTRKQLHFERKKMNKGKGQDCPECWEGTQKDICQPMGRKPRYTVANPSLAFFCFHELVVLIQ